MTFLDEFMALKDTLERFGVNVLVPEQQVEMPLQFGEGKTSVRGFLESNGGIEAFPPEHEIWSVKENAMRSHFKKIDQADAILVANYTKKGVDGYIGANTFLEIGYAFSQHKKIFLVNPLPKDLPHMEELLGMKPTIVEDIPNLLEHIHDNSTFNSGCITA